MQFLLMGFRDDAGFRVFTFQGVAADQSRSNYTVRADIALIRGFGIHIQDLPLLCRDLLALRNEQEPVRAVVFGEDDMRIFSDRCAAEKEAAQRRKALHKQPGGKPRSEWPAQAS